MKRPSERALDRAAMMLSVDTLNTEVEVVMTATLASTLAEELYLLANAIDAEGTKCDVPEPTKIPSSGRRTG